MSSKKNKSPLSDYDDSDTEGVIPKEQALRLLDEKDDNAMETDPLGTPQTGSNCGRTVS
jgi:hypothetical protein